MKLTLLIPLLLLSVGCQSIKRITDGAEQTSPAQAQINPDDFTMTGVTTKDHDSVYMAVSSHTVTVEVLRPGDTAWIKLERPDRYDYLDSYQLFKIPTEGVYFGNWAYRNADGGVTFTSTPSAPTGTQYRIHSVKA